MKIEPCTVDVQYYLDFPMSDCPTDWMHVWSMAGQSKVSDGVRLHLTMTRDCQCVYVGDGESVPFAEIPHYLRGLADAIERGFVPVEQSL